MEIWLDTIDLESIRKGVKIGLVEGVTTNPAILSQSEQVGELLVELLSIQKGLIAIQVIATEAQDMISQGRLLHEMSDRIVVKIPVNRKGLVAIRQLSQEKIPVLGTAVMHPRQALLASMAGASYIALYLSHIADEGEDAFFALQAMKEMLQHQTTPPKILVASLRQIDQIIRCAQMGIDAVTLKAELFDQLIEDSSISNSFTEKFNLKWHERFPNVPFSDVFALCQDYLS